MSRVCIDLQRISDAISVLGDSELTCDRFEQVIDPDRTLCGFRGLGVYAFVIEILPIIGCYYAPVPIEGNCAGVSSLFGCASGLGCIQSLSTLSHWLNQLP